ncbi:MAG: endolytic transglycosylase MltG [Pygmaiobacter sp.]
MKKVLSIFGILLLVGVLCLSGGYFYYAGEVDGAGAVGPARPFTVAQGSSPKAITAKLKEEGFINSTLCVKLYLKKTSAGPRLQYGDFELREGMGYDEIVTELETVNTDVATVKVTFPEGSTVLQFAKLMEEAGLCSKEEFLDVANNGDFSDLAFWSQIEPNAHCFMKAEGYLFPDTYEFFAEDSVYNMVHKLYAEFDSKWTGERAEKMKALGMNIKDVVTLASFIQEEAGDPENMPGVSGVFHNRLRADSPYPKLESDVSWYYIEDFIRPYYGGEAAVPTGMEEAYYTYDCVGLPAGPLSCPGDAAIDAALSPQASDYFFFLTDFNGKYYYAKTYDEHLNNVATMKSINGEVKASIGGAA